MTTEEDLELEARERQFYERMNEQAREEADAASWHEAVWDTADQINYLAMGSMPQAMMNPILTKCVEAMTLSHVFQSFPRMEEIRCPPPSQQQEPISQKNRSTTLSNRVMSGRWNHRSGAAFYTDLPKR